MTPTLPIDVEVQTDPWQAPTARLLHQLFERQADARPQSTAVVFGRNEATYAGLEGLPAIQAMAALKSGRYRYDPDATVHAGADDKTQEIELPKSLDLRASR